MDGRSAYFFEMNPSGLMGDALVNMGAMNRQWDGIWNARARRSDIGWTLEIEIPFSTLNFKSRPTTDQSDALPALLSREARLLPRRIRVLRLREHRRGERRDGPER